MGIKERVKEITRIYRVGHSMRRAAQSLKWRVFVILASAAVAITVYQYLSLTYLGNAATAGHPEPFSISDKLFNWFMTGFVMGAIAVALVVEGEFFLGMRRIAKALEFERRKAGKGIEKEVKKIERRLWLKPYAGRRKKRR